MLIRLARKLAFSRLGFLAAGAGAVYFLDPERGPARRAEAGQKGEAFARQQLRMAEKQKDPLQGQAEAMASGGAAGAGGPGPGQCNPESQMDLREHLRQVIHSLPARTTDVTVDVRDGVVALRGQVDSQADRDAVRAAVREVNGVRQVEDFMHLPGEEPPNKAEVLQLYR